MLAGGQVKISFTLLASVIYALFSENEKIIKECKSLEKMRKTDFELNMLVMSLSERLRGIK